MKEKAIVSTITLLTSLGSYMYAKTTGEDAVPCMLIGGYIGTILGEMVTDRINIENNN